MCHLSVIAFGERNLSREEIEDKKIIEVGSYNVNGSLRHIIEFFDPAEYVGIDIQDGPDVDIVCDAEDIIERFGEESFDVVISTETVEHIKDWKKVISNIKRICKPNGLILVSGRSPGYPYHPHPIDGWRYGLDDIRQIFSDCKILVLENDTQAPGFFVKVRKPDTFIENDLLDYELYNHIAQKKISHILNNTK